MKIQLHSRWPWLVLVALLLAGLAFVALRTGPLAPVPVQTVEVALGRVSPALFGIGQVEARRSWLVGPTAVARVRSVSVDVGQTVQPGEPLAQMEPVDLDQRLAALDAGLARADSVRVAAQAQVADAQARLALAQINWQRNQELAAQNFISSGALDGRRQELASTQAALSAAQASASAAGQDAARLQAERRALAQQRGTLRLVAPAEAVVATREAEAGSTVVAGQAVLRLVDPNSLWIRMRVDQGRSAGLVPGLLAQIALRSQPSRLITGRVERVEPLSDPVTEERLAMVRFDAVPPGVSVGEMAEVTLTLPTSIEGWVLPNAALHVQDGKTGVWRLRDSSLAFVPVVLIAQGLDGQALIAPGSGQTLSRGDTVVRYSLAALKPGSRIRVVDQSLAPGGEQ